MDDLLYAAGLQDFNLKVLDSTFPKEEGPTGLRKHIGRICEEAIQAVKEGAKFLVLSDRGVGPSRVQMPALLCCGAVHQRLVHAKLRLNTAVIVDSGETHEVCHHALLVTFGADAICPYMNYEALLKLRADGRLPQTNEWSDVDLYSNYQKAVSKGLLKVMAKIGISCLQSYKGAQIADCIGLSKEVVGMCFQGISSQLGGLGFEQLAERTLELHERGYPSVANNSPANYMFTTLPNEGQFHYRQGKDAELHMNDPMVIAKLQEAARQNSRAAYASFAALHNKLVKASSLRGQLDFKMPRQYGRTPIPLDSVEPASEIVKRFRTGAMSYGSISNEAHATLALAMNRMVPTQTLAKVERTRSASRRFQTGTP
jgi:glutamate synthase (NADPH/NADH)